MSLSVTQQEIFHEKACGKTYTELQRTHNLTPTAIAHCLKRTALGLFWKPGMQGGADPYLCCQDEQCLYFILQDHIDNNDCLRSFEVQDVALYLKSIRNQTAIISLNSIGCHDLAHEIDSDPQPPSRSWINDFTLRFGMKIRSAVEIDKERTSSGYRNNILQFLQRHAAKLANKNPEEVFNSDETMLSSNRIFKAVTNIQNMHAIVSRPPAFTHITAMITTCANGERVPPFIIFSNLQSFPQSLIRVKNLAWWGSSSTGWMTKSLFQCWAVNFANWTTKYREKINSSNRFLLILDGHSSRINSAALHYLSSHQIDVIILPSHTSHITQPFDVGIAGILKCHFKKKILQFLRESEVVHISSDSMRLMAVMALLEALGSALTPSNQMRAFEATGIVPFDPFNTVSSPYVKEGWAPLMRQNRFTINGIEATLPENIMVIRDIQINQLNANIFQVTPINVKLFQNHMFEANQIEGRLLSKFESKFVILNGALIVERY